ncbi:MAG: hypothetical protein COU85_00040 [Candidatus Portnoybacteria bacterium CG10_big_fil_rev_8_21_14_0_10_44_7]|uniref:Uncharacterized protein n=1 Tax=Candidatus Portnoybacteria bacterium CG10_big_fil_rev_8_21_14_0_10_44_7 TaxID=1974816 RepID=A0A2M8KJK1_9BACT|nr:MAG: hypothetical protein COU85_00040 [Candidatus Portnoybacteria bacterium CG10_big_fil_rev_8_21_14_0_10_44_7]
MTIVLMVLALATACGSGGGGGGSADQNQAQNGQATKPLPPSGLNMENLQRGIENIVRALRGIESSIIGPMPAKKDIVNSKKEERR